MVEEVLVTLDEGVSAFAHLLIDDGDPGPQGMVTLVIREVCRQCRMDGNAFAQSAEAVDEQVDGLVGFAVDAFMVQMGVMA